MQIKKIGLTILIILFGLFISFMANSGNPDITQRTLDRENILMEDSNPLNEIADNILGIMNLIILLMIAGMLMGIFSAIAQILKRSLE